MSIEGETRVFRKKVGKVTFLFQQHSENLDTDLHFHDCFGRKTRPISRKYGMRFACVKSLSLIIYLIVRANAKPWDLMGISITFN